MTSIFTTRAAWYEKNGEARDVMVLGHCPSRRRARAKCVFDWPPLASTHPM